MKRALTLLTVTLLAACSQQGESESAEDYATRIGGSDQGAATAPVATAAVRAAPPAGADVLALEQLGNIADVDLGPRAGGCTFSAQGTEMLIAAAPADRALPGKGVVRVGGQLLLLDAAPGGIDGLRDGSSFTGEGVTVTVAPEGAAGQRRPADLTIANAEGRAKTVSGDWVCS